MKFFRPKDGEPPKAIIIDSDGTRTGRFSAGTPLFAPGDWVLWRRDGACASHLARVSRVDQLNPWDPPTFHLWLRAPIESESSRRWAYCARTRELQPASAVDLLGRLTA